ncbi:UPF0223 family protein [uncultured Limosilactobacillus sp.]|uniref:UPF0223 family protein n=1 Tax=uncultured Limosilactobacillus sp. TaxID=2837629 RepID=UPI0025D48E66|nr:UPF0223 family protein [uncultured Limosilactobacillus sp.]
MEHNYSYPLDPSWSTAEIVTVIKMLRTVEDAYEVGTTTERVLTDYRHFKEVVSTKAGEKQLGRKFAKLSGYQLYDVVQAAKNATGKKVKLEVNKR